MAMANHNVTTLVKAPTTPRTRPLRRGFPGDGGSAAASPRAAPTPGGDRFTDADLAAAQLLVLLSDSSSDDVVLQAASRSSASSTSSLPSVSNARTPPPAMTIADEEEDDEGEGISALPGARRRYRSIRSLYEATSAIESGAERRGTAQRGKKYRT